MPTPAAVQTGAAAGAAGREFLLGQYGSEDAIERALRDQVVRE